MPRANRFFIPGAVWHITHRCHDRNFLLKFERDRMRWKYWLFQARKRFGLQVLNYTATSNHIHLLVSDSGRGEIARSMQLVAARTAQEYNKRKSRKGAFWEDRYFATAISTDHHLIRCLVYIDLNMVRAGVVTHPTDWKVSGYREIQDPPKRYGVIDWGELRRLTHQSDNSNLQKLHRRWVEEEIHCGSQEREPLWTESLAVGTESYVETVKSQLGSRARYRVISSGPKNTYQIKDTA